MKRKVSETKVGIIIAYVTTVFNLIIHLVYTPVMIKLLGQSEYGLYTLVGSVVSYLSLLSFGLNGAYLRFYSRFKAKNDEKGIANLNSMFLIVFIIIGCIAIVAGLILSQFTPEIFGSKLTPQELDKSKILMQVLVINIGIMLPCAIFESIITAHEKFLFQRFINLLGVVFNPLICLPLLILGYSSVAIVVVTTIITFVKLLFYIRYCLVDLKVKFKLDKFDFKLLKEVYVFSFFIFLNMIIDQINWSVDKFILGRMKGTADVAVYGLGMQIITLILTFSSVISSVFAPRVNRIVAKKKEGAFKLLTELMTKVGRIQFLILALVMSGLVIFGEYFITNVYASKEYIDAYMVVVVLVIPILIPLIQNIGIEIQRAVNKHKFRSIMFLIMAVLNVIISIPLAYYYGIVGAAVGTAISHIIANCLLMNLYYHFKIKLDMIEFWKSILQLFKGLIIPIFAGVIIKLFVDYNSIFEFLLWVIIYIIIYIVSFWLLGMNEYEKSIILKPINLYRQRKRT